MHVGFNPRPNAGDGFLVGLNAAQLHDDLLADMVEGARHDTDLCPFCRSNDSAAKSLTSGPSGILSLTVPSGVPTNPTIPTMEGGTTRMSDTATISTETHEALLAKAIQDATSITETALERKTIEASELSIKASDLDTEVAALKADNARLNKSLDEAQVQLKSATDEVAALKADNAAKDEDARLTQVAAARTEQVKNLKLFPEDYVTEKASLWAALSDDAWAERLDEWAKAKPGTTTATETASAMTGTTGELTKDADPASTTTSTRRSVLGLN